MSPRPRKASDEEILAAAHRTIQRLGPGELTLAAIAAEAGVTAGALVQRFGSKRELLLALAEGAATGSAEFLDGFAREHASPLARVREYARCMAHLAESPAALARNLAYLQIDLTDPDFRAHLATQARATRAWLEGQLARAVQAGELAPATDARALARTVETVLAGSLLTWAYYQDESREPAASWLVHDVDAAIAPHLAAGKGVRRTRRSS